MSRSTEATDAQGAFALDVLRNLLRYIEDENVSNAENKQPGYYTFLVSHAWTEGPMMYLVYRSPPTDRTWGLVRDTRHSIIDPGPWPDLNEAVSYYYLLDLEENWSSFSLEPGEPDTIWWRGDRYEPLPERLPDIPEAYRYTPPLRTASARSRARKRRPIINEPRRYADPL